MTQKFPPLMIALHWLTLMLIALSYVTGNYPPDDGIWGQIHVFSGIVIFVLAFIRIAVHHYYRHRLPVHPMPFMMRLGAKAVQLMLYLLLIAIPVVGYLTLVGDDPLFSLFGFSLPFIDVPFSLAGVHKMLVNIFLVTAFLHALAALFHHCVLKDGVLKSMSPH